MVPIHLSSLFSVHNAITMLLNKKIVIRLTQQNRAIIIAINAADVFMAYGILKMRLQKLIVKVTIASSHHFHHQQQ